MQLILTNRIQKLKLYTLINVYIQNEFQLEYFKQT